MLAILCYYAMLLPASYLFWRFIDEPSVRFSHWIYNHVFYPQGNHPSQRNHSIHRNGNNDEKAKNEEGDKLLLLLSLKNERKDMELTQVTLQK